VPLWRWGLRLLQARLQDGKKIGHAAKFANLMNTGKIDGSQYRGRVLLSLEIVPAPHGHPFKPSKAGQEIILRPCMGVPATPTLTPHTPTPAPGPLH
jgi:hypothetical protein